MTIIPRKIQFLILAVFVLFIAWVLINSLRLGYKPDDILAIDGINRIYIERNGIEANVPKENWRRIIEIIASSKREVFSGYKGESWRFYCNLVISTDSEHDYILQLTQRSSHGDIVPVHYLRGSISSHWSFDYYDGTNLMKTINEVVAPNKVMQQDKISASLQFCR